MQETEKIIDKKVIDYINNLNLSYDIEKDILYVNGQETNEYIARVIIAQIKRQCNKEVDIETIKKVLSDKGSFTIKEEDKELTDLFDLVDKDNNIAESEWKEYLKWKKEEALWKTDKDGVKTSLIECLQNIIGFFNHFPKYKGKIYKNKIRGYAELDGKQITDEEINKMAADLIKYMLPNYSSIKGVRDAIMNIAYTNEINIIKKWMEDHYKEYYDAKNDYIDILLNDIFRCEDLKIYKDLYYAEIKMHLIASLKKMCYAKTEAEYKYDNILVLCSVQGGTGKTSFCEYLYTFDNICYANIWEPESINFSNKDFLEQLHDSASNVFDEVSVKRSIFNAVKSFISKKNDKFRRSYGYVANNNMRKFVLWGTSNNNDFLKDYTAGLERRWMIIHISEDKMNGVYLKEKMTKDNYLFVRRLWAQVMHMYKEEPNIEMYLNHSWDDLLFKLQRDYKASNNEEYDTIINDLLEREYGFYDKYEIDADAIVSQYKYGNSFEWCSKHNNEYNQKENKSRAGEYIMKADDREIEYWGKIDRIQKTILYDILNKLHIDYTKPTLAAEMKLTERWKGCDNEPCNLNGRSIKGYFRFNKIERIKRNFDDQSDNQAKLPF